MDDGRQVLLVDLDAFYVGVERVVEPSLRGRPVAVGGGGSGMRGVVLSASYEARVAGVRSGMPVAHALRLCPDLTLAPARFELYQRASDAVFGVIAEAAPVCQQVSVDEAYLDLSGTRRLLGPTLDVAARLQREVQRRFRLELTVGLSANKLVSKVAAGVVKPLGLLDVEEGREARFLAPLKVGRLPGVGPVTRGRLEELSLKTAGDVQRAEGTDLRLAFGRMGPALRQRALGRDETPVLSRSARGSIGHQHALGGEVVEYAVLQARLRELVDSAMRRVRSAELACRTVEVELRYSDYTSRSRHHTLAEPTDIDMEVWEVAASLLRRLHQRSSGVSKVAVRLSNLVPGFQQLGLFEDGDRRRRRDLVRALDRIRDTHGTHSIRFAGNGVPVQPPGRRGIVPRVA